MKNIIGLLFTVAFGLISCNSNQATLDNNSIPDAKTEIGKVNDFLKRYEEASQTFKVSAGKPTKVTGKQGTIISIDPSDLVTENGQPLGKNIEVELKELTNQEQLLRTNAQTTSDGKLLVSGGAYFINMTSGGKQLKLKDGKRLSVEFPKISTMEMSLFYGQRDTLGKLNWQPSEEKFESKLKQKVSFSARADSATKPEIGDVRGYIERENNNRLTQEEKKEIEEQEKNSSLVDEVYKAVELKQFGWINCDRFYDILNKTNLEYSFNEKDSIISANVYLVFKDMNSVMQSEYISFRDKEYYNGFESIPVGARTQLIAFSIKNGKTYSYKSDLSVKANETVRLTLNETSKDQIAKIFQSN